jgi:acetyl esterase/lipase
VQFEGAGRSWRAEYVAGCLAGPTGQLRGGRPDDLRHVPSSGLVDRARPGRTAHCRQRPDRPQRQRSSLTNGNTLKTVADWLSDDGVASLRYDKLGSGQTGIGPYAQKLDEVGVPDFLDEAAAALRFLAGRPGVDTAHLSLWGHSEGGLYALLLATGAASGTPAAHSLGLLEPLSLRFLDVIDEQVSAQIDAAQTSGQMSATDATTKKAELDAAISQVRADGTLPNPVPAFLASVFNASSIHYLAQIDQYDPADVAAKLPSGTPVLVSCSDADIQVTCPDVTHLRTGLDQANAAVTAVQLTGVDHLLKQDASRGSSNYNASLPFSSQLQSAIRQFTASTH